MFPLTRLQVLCIFAIFWAFLIATALPVGGINNQEIANQKGNQP
jgi:hypothetical protein